MSVRSRVAPLPLTLSLALSGCVVSPGGDGGDGREPIGESAAAISVQEAADTACSTTSVKGLSQQVIEMAACIVPGAYVAVPDRPNLSLGSATLPYLEEPARDALVAALDEHPSTTMTVNSMLRTVVQQYLLYSWYLDGACGIGLAATPGSSNHETGLALDVSEYDAWKSALGQHGFSWLGSSDPVHFDYAGPDAEDFRGTDVLAFQMLWNDNHPEDLIDEDGIYGPQTEARIQASPAEGFPVPPSCGEGGAGGAGGSTTTSEGGAGGSGGVGGSVTSTSTGGEGGGEGGEGGRAEASKEASGCACRAAGDASDAERRGLVGEPSLLALALAALVRRRRRRS
jgi:hypothetical protein